MSQKNLQTQTGQQVQTEQQVQQQQLLPQHVLLVRLTEMPVEALQQRVEQECMENPWLEKASPDPSEGGENGGEDSPSPLERDGERLDAAYDYRSEEDMPDFLNGPSHSNDAAEYVSYDDTLSLTDRLREQMADFDLTEHEEELMEYLIGSLDEDGLLGKSLPVLADEAELYQGITTSPEELEKVLHVLQEFDPPGIGARSLQECLLLQVRRNEKFPYREKFITLLSKYFDDFVHKRWHRLAQKLHVSLRDTEQMQKEVMRLNPRPGGSIGSKTSDRAQSIRPDFLVDTDDDGTVTVTLASGNQPSLVISPDAEGQQDAFVRQYVERGQMFITALQQRSETMLRTMQAIVSYQKPFFQTGDETLLCPMKLDDIASATGYDISTISRAANSKYVETVFGTFPLKWFFTHRATKSDEGDDVTARQVKAALRRIIDGEDKQQPFSDEHLMQMLQQEGFNIARRTVAKYREQLGIPVARMRK
ncbi:MAG: RNA polymerase factor sigma-54 [Bacteroidaceae bacterium]|nr:RNA polymerase factor sigma-54 [Bacteroidaceae bacterium]